MDLPRKSRISWNSVVITGLLDDKIIKIIQINRLDPEGESEAVGLQRRIGGIQTRGSSRSRTPVKIRRVASNPRFQNGICGIWVLIEITVVGARVGERGALGQIQRPVGQEVLRRCGTGEACEQSHGDAHCE